MPLIIQQPGNVKRPPVDLYPRMNFPLYEFVQFPEWVTAPDGWEPSGKEEIDRSEPGKVKVLVHDEDQKRRVLDGGVLDGAEPDEKAALMAMAERKGIVVDKRWSLDTLRQKVA